MDRAAVLREAGILAFLECAVADPDSSRLLRTKALWWFDAIGPGESSLGRQFREIAANPGAYPADLAIRAYDLIGTEAETDAMARVVGEEQAPLPG